MMTNVSPEVVLVIVSGDAVARVEAWQHGDGEPRVTTLKRDDSLMWMALRSTCREIVVTVDHAIEPGEEHFGRLGFEFGGIRFSDAARQVGFVAIYTDCNLAVLTQDGQQWRWGSTR